MQTIRILEPFFEESKNKKHGDKRKYVPRNIYLDTDADSIDQIFRGPYQNLFNRESCLYDLKDHWGSGHYCASSYIGWHAISDRYENMLRKSIERCENLQGFVINHSLCGGTGGGFGNKVMERLCVDYRKKVKLCMTLFPSNSHPRPIDPYNSCLALHEALDFNT
eukprot:UN32578